MGKLTAGTVARVPLACVVALAFGISLHAGVLAAETDAGAGAAAGADAAAHSPAANGGISVRVGAGDHFKRLELAWQSPSLWGHQFSGGSARLDVVGELGVAYWRADRSRDPTSAWQFSAIPFVRWTLDDRFYLEAGVGPTVFTHSQFAGKNISTAFQFGSHIGLGAKLSRHSLVGLRFSHFSNGGIQHPNPGFQVLQLSYTYQY